MKCKERKAHQITLKKIHLRMFCVKYKKITDFITECYLFWFREDKIRLVPKRYEQLFTN